MKISLRALLSVFGLCSAIASELFAQQPDGTRGMYFGGSNFIQVANSPSLNLTNNFTIEAWIKLSEIPDTAQSYSVVSKRGAPIGGYEFKIADGGKLQLLLSGSGSHTTLNNYITQINRWYHIAISFTNTVNGVSFFVNGNLVEQLNGTGLPILSVENLRIGADNISTGADFFQGQIDEVRISNNVRYSSSFTPPIAVTTDINAVAVYNFDETFGQVITDQSTFNNIGILGTTATVEPTDAIRAIRTINMGDSGSGSLRQAIDDANFNADINFLDFSIPNAAPWIINLTFLLPEINTRVILDGTSQFGWSETSLIELNGAAISVSPPDTNGLLINTGGAESEVYGMEIYGFNAGSFPSGIYANAANLKIGAAGKRNVLRNNGRGIYLFGSASGTVISHNYIGLDKTGNIAQGNAVGVGIAFANNVQVLTNVISANNENIRIPTSNGSILRGNRIGTNAAGTSAAYAQTTGIFLGGSANNIIIGGTTPTETNIIGGHSDTGIRLFAGDNQTIRGNIIGTDISGTVNLGNLNNGIDILTGSIGSIIGGVGAGESNVIAYNGIGINISGASANNALISGNSIYCNVNNGIRLDGTGANANKAAPVITTATVATVSGTAAPGDIIEIFRDNPTVCGFANQGRIYVATVTANALGNWTYTGSFPTGSRLTATATDGSNNTSSFSTAFQLPLPYTTRGVAIWNTNGNWSLDDGLTDCSCNPAGQNNVTIILRHTATVLNAGDIGLNNTIEIQNNGELFLQAQPTNQIAELRTSGAITSLANVRFGYVPVNNDVVAINNLDNTNSLVAVIFDSGDGIIPPRIGTEATPKPYPSLIILAGNKTMQFPAGADNYFINGNFFMAGGASLSFDAATAGNTLAINGSVATITGGSTLNANDIEVKLIINSVLRNSGGIINGSISGLEFVNGARYEHSRDGGEIPLAAWSAGSFCFITDIVNNAPSGFGQTFGHFVWNCPNQNITVNTGTGADMTVLGNFLVLNTGTSARLVFARNLNLAGSFDNQVGIPILDLDGITTSFIGSGLQNISGGSGVRFRDLIINQSPANIVDVSSSNLIILNSLELREGRIRLNNTDLSFAGAPTGITRANGWVETNGGGFFAYNSGSVATDVLFPVGSDTNYQPVRIANVLAGGAIARFGSPSIPVPNSGLGAWVVRTFGGASALTFENPQSAGIDANSKIHIKPNFSSVWNLVAGSAYTAPDYTSGATAITTGDADEFSIFTPVITYSATDLTAVNINENIFKTANQRVYAFQMTTTGGSPTLTGVSFNTSSFATYTGSDISGFKLYYNTTDDFSTATLISSASPSSGAGETVGFTCSQVVPSANPNYFYIAVDVNPGAFTGRTFQIDFINATSAFSFLETVSDAGSSLGSSGTKTIQPFVPNTQPLGNRGLYFDGVDDFVKAPPIAFPNMTMQAWIKPAAWGGGIVSTLGDFGSGNNGLSIALANNGEIVLSLGEDGNRDWVFSGTGNIAPINRWTHVAGTYDGNTLRIYMDGVLVNATPSVRALTPQHVIIGSDFEWGWRFNGQIDEVRVFNTARIDLQIQADMGSATPNGALAYWNFDHGTGTSASDISGNGNDGALPPAPNTPLWALRVTNTAATGAESFRQVITEANTLAGRNYIDFSIPATDPNYSGGVWTIEPFVGIPANVTDGSIIDGYSAFGAAPATTGTPATIAIQLSAPTIGNTLQLAGIQPSTVKGLSIAQSTSNGLAALWLSGTAGHTVQGNHIGVNAAGTAAFPAATSGALVIQSSSNNTVGGTAPAARNIISGADNNGIRIDGFIPSDNNQIWGNYIGTAANGVTPLPNGSNGILINSGAANNQIGNGAANGRNIIAHNAGWGVEITGGGSANTMRNNHIYENFSGGITLATGSNNDKAAPVVSTFSPTLLSGACEAGDIVEVFADSPQTGTTNQGRQFLGLATVTGANWTLAGAFTAGTRYTATATDASGNTSPFSAALPFDFTTAQSGNWNDPATWVGGVAPPPSGANVTVAASHSVTANVNVTLNSLTIAPTATLNMGVFVLNTSLITLGGTLNLGSAGHTLNQIADNGGTGRLIANNLITSTLIGTLTGNFFDVAGNVVEFGGTGGYSLPVRNYPSIETAGTGDRTFAAGTEAGIAGNITHNSSGSLIATGVDFRMLSAGSHIITGTSGIGIFIRSIAIDGNTTLTGSLPITIGETMNINSGVALENTNASLTFLVNGNIIGDGTFRNLGTLNYQSNNNIAVSNFDAGLTPNLVVYESGAAQVRPATYDHLALRNTRTTPASATITANRLDFDDVLPIAASLTLGDDNTIVVNNDLAMSNPSGALLDLGTGNASVTVNGNLLAATAEIRSFPSAGNAQVLELRGATNELSLYDASGDATVRYSGSNQQVLGSSDYMNVEITGGGVKSLQGIAGINGQLRLLSGSLQLNGYNLTLANPVVADQLTGAFVNSWVATNGSGRLIRQGAGSNVVFPVGDAAAARPLTMATTASGSTAVAFTNTISPSVTAANIAAGMWSIVSPAVTTNLIFENVGGAANVSSEIYRSNSPWVLVPTNPTRPPYSTASPVVFSGTPQNFTVFSNSCLTPVISLVQDESAFLCSATAGRITVRLQEASLTNGVTYDIDLNGDNVWDIINLQPINNILLADNLQAGTLISNPKVRVSGTSCISAPAPFNLTISGKKPLVLAAEITAPTSCVTPDGKLLLRIRNGIVNGFYHVDLNNDGINELTNLRLRNDSTLLAEGIAEKTPLSTLKVIYTLSNCASEPFVLNSIMPDAPRPTVNLTITADNEADPDEIIAIRVQNIEAGVSYRLMNDATQVGQPQSGAAGTTLTFNTPPLVRNSTYHILAKRIDAGCEVELELKINIRVYHEVTDSLTLVAFYNSANGANWQPAWNLRTPVRTWQGVSVRKGRINALTLNGRGLTGLINPVLQLPRLNALNIANNRLEFDAFENVLPALASRGISLAFSPQAPVNEELTIAEFETKTVTLRTTIRGARNTYQWFKDNRLVAGATAAELTLRNLTVQDAGVYTCEVRNPAAPALVIQRRRITLNVLQYMRSQTDSLVLVELYRTMGGDNWIQRFDFRNPVANWPGIQTSNGRVTSINLANNNLIGEIPDIFIELRGLGILDELEYLNLSNNKITGRIPESLTNHRKLTYLDLSFNWLEGEIPAYISAFAELRTLWLSGNRFTRLPREIGQLSKLTNLLLDGNLLEQLPDEIGLLRNLQILRVNGNRLRTVPQAIAGMFANLKILGLADNSIETLPAAFDNLPDGLEQLLLHNNRLLTVPLNIAERQRLQLLTIYGNRMDFGIIEPLMLRFRDRRSGAEVLYAPQAPVGNAAELTIENGQPFTLTIRTGGAANRYRWFKDSNPLSNDLNIADYTVTRSQANDTGSYWVHITNSHAPDLTLVSLITQVQVTCSSNTAFTIRAQGNTELCGNEPFSAVLQVTGMENAAEIRWLRNGSLLAGIQGRNFTPQTAGRYRAMVRTEGQNCFAFSGNEIEIQIINNLTLTLTVAQGGRLFAQVAGAPSVQRYEWFRNGQLIAATTTREFTAEQAGSYSVSLITSNGCRFTSAAIAIDNTIVGIEDWPLALPLRLYPNPTRSRLQLQSSLLKIEDCQVFNAVGQPVSAIVEKQISNEWLFDVSGLAPGAYLLRCRTYQGEVWLKWVKE